MILISKNNIQQYVPQYPPFLMVDTLDVFEDQKAVSTFTITNDNILLDTYGFSDAGMLENMAQTCALHAGYKFIQGVSSIETASDATKKAPVGFIGSIKDYVATQYAQVGDTIHTEVVIEHSIGLASVIRGQVFFKEEMIATCEMKIFLSE